MAKSIRQLCKERNQVRAKIKMNGEYAKDTFPYGMVELDGPLTDDQATHLLAFIQHVVRDQPFEEALAEVRKEAEAS